MTLEGDLKDTPQSVKKKEEAPFCHFVINMGVNVRRGMTDCLWVLAFVIWLRVHLL